MHPSDDFETIFYIVWRALRQFIFKFTAGEA